MCHMISHLNDLEGDKIHGGGWVSEFMLKGWRGQWMEER